MYLTLRLHNNSFDFFSREAVITLFYNSLPTFSFMFLKFYEINLIS